MGLSGVGNGGDRHCRSDLVRLLLHVHVVEGMADSFRARPVQFSNHLTVFRLLGGSNHDDPKIFFQGRARKILFLDSLDGEG